MCVNNKFVIVKVQKNEIKVKLLRIHIHIKGKAKYARQGSMNFSAHTWGLCRSDQSHLHAVIYNNISSIRFLLLKYNMLAMSEISGEQLDEVSLRYYGN